LEGNFPDYTATLLKIIDNYFVYRLKRAYPQIGKKRHLPTVRRFFWRAFYLKLKEIVDKYEERDPGEWSQIIETDE
jgi:hypothetical protein